MRTQFKLLTVMLLIVLLSVAGCTSSANQPVPTPEAAEVTIEMPTAVSEPPTAVSEPTVAVDPTAAVVLGMIERVNAEDYAGAADYFADDAMIYLAGMPPTGMEIYRGKEQYRTFLEECCTGANFVYEVIPERVEGDVVFASGKTWMDFTRDLGVAPNSWHEIFVVEDGKITLYNSTITEEALANFKPALAAVMPELFEVALPEGETPVSEVTFTIADGSCAYDGSMTLQAGELTVNVDVQDEHWEKYAVTLFTLDEDKDMLDLMASTYNAGPPSWSNLLFLKELAPDANETYQDFTVDEGLLYMVCWGGSPDIAIGNAGPFVVVE